MKYVDVMMKSFKKDSGAIGVIASKVNSYFIIRLLIFDLHFQYTYVENNFILLFKDEQTTIKKILVKQWLPQKILWKKTKMYWERKNENIKNLQENTKSTHALKSPNNVYKLIESDQENIKIGKKLNWLGPIKYYQQHHRHLKVHFVQNNLYEKAFCEPKNTYIIAEEKRTKLLAILKKL